LQKDKDKQHHHDDLNQAGDAGQNQATETKSNDEPVVEEDQSASLTRQLADKQKENDELQQRYLRLAADFDNYRRRSRQEIEEIRSGAAARLLGELLPLQDNFERGLESARSKLPENVLTGINMIYNQLTNILVKEGVQPVECVGKLFDPAYQEAFEQVETNECPDGAVICELQKGFLLGGKVLRPALVKVAKNAQPDQQQDNKQIDASNEGEELDE
jgi:molecular chaperone GrpE